MGAGCRLRLALLAEQVAPSEARSSCRFQGDRSPPRFESLLSYITGPARLTAACCSNDSACRPLLGHLANGKFSGSTHLASPSFSRRRLILPLQPHGAKIAPQHFRFLVLPEEEHARSAAPRDRSCSAAKIPERVIRSVVLKSAHRKTRWMQQVDVDLQLTNQPRVRRLDRLEIEWDPSPFSSVQLSRRSNSSLSRFSCSRHWLNVERSPASAIARSQPKLATVGGSRRQAIPWRRGLSPLTALPRARVRHLAACPHTLLQSLNNEWHRDGAQDDLMVAFVAWEAWLP